MVSGAQILGAVGSLTMQASVYALLLFAVDLSPLAEKLLFCIFLLVVTLTAALLARTRRVWGPFGGLMMFSLGMELSVYECERQVFIRALGISPALYAGFFCVAAASVAVAAFAIVRASRRRLSPPTAA